MIKEADSIEVASSSLLWVYVVNVDDVYNKALRDSCISVMEPTYRYQDDRVARVIDLHGIQSLIAGLRSIK